MENKILEKLDGENASHSFFDKGSWDLDFEYLGDNALEVSYDITRSGNLSFGSAAELIERVIKKKLNDQSLKLKFNRKSHKFNSFMGGSNKYGVYIVTI